MIALAIAILAASASASVRTAKVEVGDPFFVQVRVVSRPSAMVTIRPPPSRLPAYTVEAGGQRLVQADADGIAVFTYEVIPWAAGELVLGPTEVDIGGIGGVASNRVTLNAFNPLGGDAAAETAKPVRDIRPFPVREPLWIWIVAGAVLAAFGWWFLRARPKPAEEAVAPLRPPPPSVRIETLAELMERVKRIAEKPPREPAHARDAHFAIAEAVRRFVEERWEVPASRQTTEEFLDSIRESGRFRGGGMSLLPVVLEACDRVKWSGDSAAPQETLEVARLALDFFAASRGAIRGLGGLQRDPSHPSPFELPFDPTGGSS